MLHFFVVLALLEGKPQGDNYLRVPSCREKRPGAAVAIPTFSDFNLNRETISDRKKLKCLLSLLVIFCQLSRAGV
jgi:hypothetical protein